jgi:hypothetical protein
MCVQKSIEKENCFNFYLHKKTTYNKQFSHAVCHLPCILFLKELGKWKQIFKNKNEELFNITLFLVMKIHQIKNLDLQFDQMSVQHLIIDHYLLFIRLMTRDLMLIIHVLVIIMKYKFGVKILFWFILTFMGY